MDGNKNREKGLAGIVIDTHCTHKSKHGETGGEHDKRFHHHAGPGADPVKILKQYLDTPPGLDINQISLT